MDEVYTNGGLEQGEPSIFPHVSDTKGRMVVESMGLRVARRTNVPSN